MYSNFKKLNIKQNFIWNVSQTQEDIVGNFNMYCIFLNVNMASISSCGLIIFANTMKRKKEKKKEIKKWKVHFAPKFRWCSLYAQVINNLNISEIT